MLLVAFRWEKETETDGRRTDLEVLTQRTAERTSGKKRILMLTQRFFGTEETPCIFLDSGIDFRLGLRAAFRQSRRTLPNSEKEMKPSSTPIARWTPSLEKLRALTIRQPWAWLIVNGFKDIENRSRRTHYRGPILIHAGLSGADLGDGVIEDLKAKYRITLPREVDVGGIIGVVDLVDCVERHKSKWFHGPFGWVLANPRRLRFRDCKGALGIFRPKF